LIEAKRSPILEHAFHLYLHFQLKRSFHAVWYRHDRQDGPPLNFDTPILVYANHSSWWDGLLLFWLNRTTLHRQAYAWMSYDGLTRYPFFRRLGAFAGQTQSAADMRQLWRYVHQLAGQRQAMVAIFPEGAQRLQGDRPIGFQKGLARLVDTLDPTTLLYPLAIHYASLEHAKWDVFLHLGTPETIASCQRLRASERQPHLERTLTDLADEQLRLLSDGVRTGVAARDEFDTCGYRNLLARNRSGTPSGVDMLAN